MLEMFFDCIQFYTQQSCEADSGINENCIACGNSNKICHYNKWIGCNDKILLKIHAKFCVFLHSLDKIAQLYIII